MAASKRSPSTFLGYVFDAKRSNRGRELVAALVARVAGVVWRARGFSRFSIYLHKLFVAAVTTFSKMSYPRFWSTPFRYLRWASHEKPAIFYSIAVGCLGPVLLVVVPPVRRRLGDGPRDRIPLTYPSESNLSTWMPNLVENKYMDGCEPRIHSGRAWCFSR